MATAALSAAAASSDVKSSLLDALVFQTRAFFAADDTMHAATLTEIVAKAPAVAAKVAGLNQTLDAAAFPESPLSTLMPSNSAMLACVLALVLYIASWTLLGDRSAGAADDEDERNNASFNALTSPKKDRVLRDAEAAAGLLPRPPMVIRLLQSLFRVCVLLSQCVVYVGHVFWNRCLPFRASSVYLRGFTCASMPDDWTVSSERFRRTALQNFGLADAGVEFCMKLLGRSGLGEQTYFPPGLMSYPPDLSMQSARAEAEYIFCNALDALFASTGIKPRDVDILIVNCSLFAPTPSLAAMIMNKYKMREDTDSYNLSGMGCSAGLISLHLAKDLLQRHPNSLAVVVSTELITQQIYTGSEPNMLLQNSLFRSGGAAIALSNKSTDFAFGRCKYELLHTVRTTLAADVAAYGCVYQDEDKAGKRGVRLGKELMNVAGKAMQKNITRLGPLILPYSEQIKFALNLVARQLDCKFRIVDKLVAMGIVAKLPPPSAEEIAKAAKKAEQEAATAASAEGSSSATAKPRRPTYKSRIPEYTPDFKKAVDHICIHAGGRAVIDAIQAGLKLSDDDVAASRAILKRYGNTSSSSIWYEFRYCELHRKVKKGDKIWQLGFGSGFKCNSAIWRKL